MTTSRVVPTSDWKVLEVLAHDFSLDGETVAGFALLAERLAQPYRRTVLNSPPEIRAGRVAIAGLMNQGGWPTLAPPRTRLPHPSRFSTDGRYERGHNEPWILTNQDFT